MIGFALIGYGAAALIWFIFSLIFGSLLKIESVKDIVFKLFDVLYSIWDYLLSLPAREEKPRMNNDEVDKP